MLGSGLITNRASPMKSTIVKDIFASGDSGMYRLLQKLLAMFES